MGIKQIIRSIAHKSREAVLKLLNSIYFLSIPKRRRIVISGFFSKSLGRIKRFNFGDDLNFYILGKLYPHNHIFSANNLLGCHRNLLFIGSIIGYYANEKSIIWGSGAIEYNEKIDNFPLEVKAVRGPLTRQILVNKGIDCPEIYSDPALILPILYTPQRPKKYKYGIIPHYADLNSPKIEDLVSTLGNKVTVISLINYDNIETVIDRINECEYIISSSLHGIIISDAYSIPNMWIELSDKVYGKGFKFADYFAAVNRNECTPLNLNEDNIQLGDIEKKLSKYTKPTINILPLLLNAPIKISSQIIERVRRYQEIDKAQSSCH